MIIELKSRKKRESNLTGNNDDLLKSIETILDEVGYKAYEFSMSPAPDTEKQMMRREIQLKMDHMKYTIEKTMCRALGE